MRSNTVICRAYIQERRYQEGNEVAVFLLFVFVVMVMVMIVVVFLLLV